MSPRDVHPDEMFDEDPMLSAFARDLEQAAASSPLPEIGPALAAVLEGRTPVATYPEVVVPDAAPRPVRPVRRARLRWAVGAAVFGLGVGSLGVAGALPAPVQRQVSRMADVVGVHLPDGEHDADDAPVTPETTTSTTLPSTTTTVRPTHPTTATVGEPGDDSTTTTADDHGSSGNGDGHGNDGSNGHGNDDDHGPATTIEDRSGHGGGDDAEVDTDEDADEVDTDEDADEVDSSGHGGGDESADDRSGPSSAQDRSGKSGDDDVARKLGRGEEVDTKP